MIDLRVMLAAHAALKQSGWSLNSYVLQKKAVNVIGRQNCIVARKRRAYFKNKAVAIKKKTTFCEAEGIEELKWAIDFLSTITQYKVSAAQASDVWRQGHGI